MCGGSKTITTITVASVAFNVNGTPAQRRKYTPTQVFAAIMRNTQSLSGDITQALLKGPNIKFRSLLNHAKNSGYYEAVGQNKNDLGIDFTLEHQLELEKLLAGNGDSLAIIEHASIQPEDWNMITSRFAYQNPEHGRGENDFTFGGHEKAYSSNNNTVYYHTICTDYYFHLAHFAYPLAILPTQRNPDYVKRIYVLYRKPTFVLTQPIVTEAIQTDLIEFPEELQWMYLVSNNTVNKSSNRNKTTQVTITYSDNRPSITTTNTVSLGSVSWQNFTRTYKKTAYQFSYENVANGKVYDCLRVTQNIFQTGTIQQVQEITVSHNLLSDNVVETTTTTVTTDALVLNKSSQRTRQGVNITDYGQVHVWEYKHNTGDANLNGWINNYPMTPFFPVIPIRRNNKMISQTHPAIAERNHKLLRRGYDFSYYKLEDALAEHPDLKDIDHAYMLFGVPINAKDTASKLYLFKFFEYFFKDSTTKTPHGTEGWMYSWNRRKDPSLNYPYTGWNSKHYPSMVNRVLHIKNNFGLHLIYGFHYRGFITGTGKAYGDMKSGEVRITLENFLPYTRVYWPMWSHNSGYVRSSNYWTEWDIYTMDAGDNLQGYLGYYPKLTSTIGSMLEYSIGYGDTNQIRTKWGTSTPYPNIHTSPEIGLNNYNIIKIPFETVYVITYQTSSNRWRQVRIMGLTMENHIYSPKYTVKYYNDQQIGLAEDSDFIIPLHEGVLRSMNFLDATEVCTQAGFILCNCFTIHVQKIKKKGFLGFLIGIVVAVIAITIAVIQPELAPAMSSMFTSIGTALGLTGTAAVIAGGAVSMLAGVILTQVITNIASLIFGDKLGGLIGSVISVVVGNAVMGMMQGMSVVDATRGLMSAEGVIAMTSAVGKGLQGYFEISAQEKATKLENFMETRQEQLKSLWDRNQEIIAKRIELTGKNSFYFNGWSPTNESRDAFLTRTLLVGSDVAAITNGYITNYVSSTLRLKPAFE